MDRNSPSKYRPMEIGKGGMREKKTGREIRKEREREEREKERKKEREKVVSERIERKKSTRAKVDFHLEQSFVLARDQH